MAFPALDVAVINLRMQRPQSPCRGRAAAGVLVASLLLACPNSVAEEPSVDFVRDIQPIFRQHCYRCHGEQKQRSGLRLDIKSKAFSGGELYGPAVVEGDEQASPVVQFVSREDADLPMPPEGEPLSQLEVELLGRWVRQGANWPEGVDTAELEDRLAHWSLQPIARPSVPPTGHDTWPRNAVDRFILHRLEQEGLTPAPAATRREWLRRATLDLTGLWPTPEQTTAFIQDTRADAYERVVDRLLASPRYGERWAQHWLDVVRYADTHGFEVNTERPHAWHYRDYVIEALNRDLPYDQFVRQQIAGDALGADRATGFLVTASVLLPGQIGKDEASKRLARQDAIDEIVVNISQTFMGLSVGCARCHDHKFDPISQRDYYAMQAFVAGVEYGDRALQTPTAMAKRQAKERLEQRLAEIEEALSRLVPLAISGHQRPAVNPRLNVDRFQPVTTDRLRFTIEATNRLEPCIDELEVFSLDSQNVALAERGTLATSSGNRIAENRHELRFIHDGEYGNSRSWMSDQTGGGWVELEFPEDQTIDRVHWGRDRLGEYADRLATTYRIEVADDQGNWVRVADASDRIPYDGEEQSSGGFSTVGLDAEQRTFAERLLAEKEQIENRVAELDAKLVAFAGRFRSPDTIRLLTRGDPEQPRDEVAPAVPEALGELQLVADSDEQTRRLELAEWLTRAEHPLTARVMVNRIWQGHFGVGLVETSNDFGLSGVAPTHPDLLDWLASEYVRGGWSNKDLHRKIVLSSTYRQSTRFHPAAAELDAQARWLWRFPPRRIEGEAIRDCILDSAGRLNRSMGGRGYNLFEQRGGLSGFDPIESFSGEGLKRMIYAHRVRRERDAVFGAFDCPDNGQATGRRRESTTPIQALNLLNSRFTIDAARALANRISGEMGTDDEAQIDRLYRLTLGRPPTDLELAKVRPVMAEHGLATVCRVMINSNEFLFLP